MALVIKDSSDLLEYLKTRKKFMENQKETAITTGNTKVKITSLYEVGAVYAFEEAIKAVEALIATEKSQALDSSS